MNFGRALVFIGVVALAQDSGGHRIAPGPVVVRIKSTADGKPLGGIVVRLGGRYAATGADGSMTLDGVPEGSYKLTIDEFGTDRLERQIELPAGKREPIELSLTPITLVPIKGSVTADAPVPGARITLCPVDVPSAVKGRFDFCTHWDGTFAVLEIPAGRYRADVSAPGCIAKSFDMEIKKDAAPFEFKLDRDSRPADLAVTVQNSVTGQPIAGAAVELAEAWPQGKIAEGKTDAAGAAAFKDLRVGRFNPVDAKGRVTVCRRQATVRVEAAGFEPTLAMVSLDKGSAVAVAVNPTDKIVEAEPNDTLATAQPVHTGAPIELKIPKVGDKDFFKFRLKDAARLKITLGPKNPIQTFMRLHGPDGKPIRENGVYENVDNVLDVGVQAGEYILEVEEWGNDASSDKPLTLLIACDTAPDPLEPNDTPESARLLQSGEEARGAILPIGDVDMYRFEMKRAGVARLTVPSTKFQRQVVIRDETGKSQAEQGVYEGRPIEIVVSLQPGWHTAEVHEWGNDNLSTEPYTLRLEISESDGLGERVLSPNSIGGATINPVRDVDRYRIALPSAGQIFIRGVAPTQLFLRLLSTGGKVLAEQGVYEKQVAEINWSAPGPAIVILEAHEWGDDGWSSWPYTLRTVWRPCDDQEFMGRNDKAESATPAEPGDVLRGSLMPVGDVDWYRFVIDHPGYLRLEGLAPTQTMTRILDANQKVLAEVGAYENQPIRLAAEVPAGACYVQVREWGDDASHVSSYAIKTMLDRAEPGNGAVRALKLNEAQSFTISQAKDRDVFVFDVPQAGKFSIRLKTALQTYIRVFDDRSGTQLHESGHYEKQTPKLDFEAKGPTRYRIELTEWGQDSRSAELGYVMIDTEGKEIGAEKIDVVIDPCDPTLVTFKGKGDIDADGDGKIDLQAPGQFRYRSEGLYPATAVQGKTISRFWVDANGPRERKGVHVIVDFPAEGQTIERDEPCRVRAISYTGTRVSQVALSIDGRFVAAAYSEPFEFHVPWRSLSAGPHELAFSAGGRTVKRSVQVSEYFDLTPEDGATLSGNDVRVSWTGGSFGPAKVKYRLKGAADWKEAIGEDGRARRVTLSDLESAKPYEFQPGDGPIRTVTRVKGLAFGRSKYAATINRDYDQKLGISVRNHGDKPMTVRLECGKPEDATLLVGFVGEGSEGAPFPLNPGEEREFLLGLSAQDVVKPQHRFPIRITSDSGFADQAEVEVLVKLPVVKLEWEALPASGMNRKFRLVNKGDTLTDLSLACDAMTISPSVKHGMLQAGGSLEVTAIPKLFEGFRGIEGKIAAKSLDKTIEQDVKIALKENEKIFGVQLTSGAGSDLLTARAMAGAYLSPKYLEKKTWENPQDTDGDGKVDRWTIDDKLEGILWVGDDTDGDGEIDFVHADIGSDGQFDYSAFKTKDGWEETNLVEAWLEMGFKLPWARSAYEKHDLDVVMNGRVVASLRDVIPEGNYTFRLPPSVLKFTPEGTPDASSIEIQSKHLRGGHYVVNSDFRIKLRLTGTRVWVVAESEAAAKKVAGKAEGLSTEGADYSVSSAELKQEGDEITVPVRNIGATRTRSVAVALFRGAVELQRVYLNDVPLSGARPVRLPWKPVPGTHTLRVVVDPDGEIVDTNRDNNEAVLTVTAPGVDAKPTVKLDASVSGTVLSFKVDAADDNGLAKVEIRIDNGLWRAFTGDSGKALLQPGEHTITARATDGSGNQVEDSKRVKVEAAAPSVEIVEAIADERQSPVKIKAGDDAVLVAVRVNGGPWTKETVVPLAFGKGTVEVMAASKTGAIRIASRAYACTKQPAAGEERAVMPDRGIIDIEGLGPVDLFGTDMFVFPKKAEGPAQKMAGEVHVEAPEGGLIGVQQKQSDWYCTNRPNIKVGFQLPEWVRRLKLPKPGTKEYNEMIQRLLAELRARGIDTGPFERFQAALIRRIRTLEGPDALPGFLESLGFGGPKPKNPQELEEWRDRMQELAEAWWLRLLASGDPELIAAGLRARGEAIGKFDEASQLSAEAVIETIKANQKLTEDVMNALPYVGDAMNIVALATGETLSGEKMTALGYIMGTVGLLGPAAISKILETKSGRAAFEAIAEKAASMGEAAKALLAQKLGIPLEKLEATLAKIGDTLTKERHVFRQEMDEAAEAARKTFKNSAEGIKDLQRMKADEEAARKLIDDLRKAKTPEELHQAVMNIQADKTAQKLIHEADVADDLRKAAKGHIEEIYNKVDEGVKQELRNSEHVKELARKNGLDPSQVEVEVMTITNVRKPKPNDITKLGRDRDVTYIVTTKKPDGTRVVLQDVDHAISKEVYERHFWTNTRKDPLPADATLISKYADKMDQTVTSKWHPEAYNPGEVKLNEFLDKSKTPTLTRIEDVRDTVTFKSDHWFEKAQHAANPTEAAKHTAEGMRQATKQYDDLVMSRVNQYIADPRIAQIRVPPRLEKGIEIFKQVEKGAITPAQAERMLDALSHTTPGGVKIPVTKEKIVADMGAFLESVEKTAGTAYRKLKTDELARALGGMPGKGGAAWAETSLQKINEALVNGHVSGETFLRMRDEVTRGFISGGQPKEAVRDWLTQALARRLINQAEAERMRAELK